MAEKLLKTAITGGLVFIYLMALLSLSGCSSSPTSSNFKPNASPIEPIIGSNAPKMYDANIVKVRNCEYIISHVYYGTVYTHCGDCSNPDHIENVYGEEKPLIIQPFNQSFNEKVSK